MIWRNTGPILPIEERSFPAFEPHCRLWAGPRANQVLHRPGFCDGRNFLLPSEALVLLQGVLVCRKVKKIIREEEEFGS